MVVTDPIADLLTRIRNALTAKHDAVSIPASRIKKAIADILLEEGYIKKAEVIESENGHKNILITLKYGQKYEKVINNLRRISKPGLRVYCASEDLPKVLGGLGIAIISTSKGLMTDKTARAQGIGGEVLAYVW
ncbi:MAG: 30S ribosomal protein S8 [Firmicutes bacterium]|nr:30S ribosomal protein S8 [Bacillota bacterium]